MKIPQFWLAWSALFVSYLLVSGCGSCPAVQEERTRFDARGERSNVDGPHLRLEISTNTLNRQLNDQKSRVGSKDLSLPGLGNIGRYVGRYKLELKRLELRFDKRKAASLGLQIALKQGRSEILYFDLLAKAPVVLNKKKGTVRMSFKGDMFERVEVKPSRQAANRLASHFRSLLPASVRPFIPQKETAEVASTVIRRLSGQLYQEIKDEILKPIGEFASFSFQLPDVPIDAIGIVTIDKVIAIEMRTSLKASGLKPLRRPSVEADQVRLTVSTDAVAELGNWGMYTGKIPNRFSMKGKAEQDGPFSAGLNWVGGQRPMKVHLFSSEQATGLGCMYIRAGATPRLSFTKKKLKVGFRDGKLEELVGPPLVNEVSDILGISSRAFSFTKEVSLKQKLKVGSRALSIALDGVALKDDTITFDLKLN